MPNPNKRRRLKANPLRAAASMLTFYLGRATRKLSAKRQRAVERAKTELRKAFRREPR